MIVSHHDSTAFLDTGLAKIQSDKDATEIMMRLVLELQQVRNSLSRETWRQFATIACRQHPIMALLHQDPFTWRAFSKPRGYAGDAVLEVRRRMESHP